MSPPGSRPREAHILRIAPGRVSRLEQALQSDELVIGWSRAVGLLDPGLSWGDFRQIVHDIYYSKDPTYRRAGHAAGSLWRYIKEMQTEDLVVVPEGRQFYVAQVTGSCYFDESMVNDDSAYRRPVRWLNSKRPIPRSTARAALQSRMKIQQTCADASDLLEDIQLLLDEASEGLKPTFEEDIRRRLIKEARDEIRSGRLEPYGFERLVSALLRSMGASEVRIIPRREDVGADILANFSIASTFEVQLAVQAKHYLAKPPVPAEVVDDLVRGMGAANTAFGWVVTSGTISEGATKRTDEVHEQQGLSIQLVDGEQLAAMLIESGLKPGVIGSLHRDETNP